MIRTFRKLDIPSSGLDEKYAGKLHFKELYHKVNIFKDLYNWLEQVLWDDEDLNSPEKNHQTQL